MRVLLIVAGLALILLSLSGCNSEPDTTDYFPLNEGLSW